MHTLTFTEDDHITFQLYEASTNTVKVKSRRKSFLILLGLSLLLALYGYLKEETFMMYYGFLCTFLVLCFGNIYLRWRHKRHYTKQVRNHLKLQSEEIVRIEVMDDHIRMIDKISDSKVRISEITEVNEIEAYYFFKLSIGPKLVIPKTIPALNEELNVMIRRHDIPHVVQLDWKWR